MDELYNDLYGNKFTIISNEFLDKYLSDTKPEYIKVFLFYIWKGLKEGYTISETANEIDLDENIVEMALKYWIKKKLMKKDCLVRERTEKNDKIDNLVDFKTKKNELINNRKEYSKVEADLLFVAEKLLGQTMSERQQNLIAKCYNEYGFDEGLIQYLIEYCSEKSQTNAKYMGAVAASWYEQGIKTMDAAKKYVASYENKGMKSTKKNTKSNVIDRKEYDKKLMESMFAGK